MFTNYSNNPHLNHPRTTAVKREIGLSFIIKIVSVLIGILIVPLTIDFMDTERYGIWLTLSSVFGWFSFFDIGFGNGMRNKVAEALANGNKILAKEYISTTYAAVSLIFLTLIFLFLIVNPFINWQKILNTDLITTKELYLVTSVVFTLFLLRFIFQLIGVVFIANQRPSVNNAIITIGNLFAFIIIIILYRLLDHGSLLLLGAVLTGAPLLIFIVATLVAFNGKFRYLRPSLGNAKVCHAKHLLNLGAKFFLIQIAAVVLFSSANIIIIQIFNPEEVAVYSTALRYFQVPIMIYGILMTPIWSAVTDANARNDIVWMKDTIRKFNGISAIFAIGIIIMTLLSPFVYELWLGDRINIPFSMSISMAFYAVINIFLSPFTSFINGIGKMHLSVILTLMTVTIYIPLAIFLAKLFNSSTGIMIATCILNATGLYFQPKQLYKLLNGTARGVWGK